MKRKIFFTLAVLITIACLRTFAQPEAKLNSKYGFVMNTEIRISAYSDNLEIIDGAYDLLVKLDKMLSMYDENSEISKINSLAGIKNFNASPEILEILKDSLKVYDMTEGIFNPLIGPVTKLWKINRPDGELPTPESLDIAVKLSNISNLEIQNDSVYLKNKGCILDFGGIAKGYASTKIAELFKNSGVESALIDLGGNIQTVGNKPDGSKWNIGVRDPSQPNDLALVLSVGETSVITSGGYERYKRINGKKYQHFFDVKTGEAITNDLLSVTVLTPDGSIADGLATGFMAAGFEKSLMILKNIPASIGVVFIRLNDDKPEVFATKNLEGLITRSKYKIIY